LANNAVDTLSIQNDAVTSAKIAAGQVGTSELAPSSVDTLALQDSSVTAAKIANDTITAAQIAANAVGSSELADNAVDTAAIQDGAVTAAKIGALTTKGDLAVGKGDGTALRLAVGLEGQSLVSDPTQVSGLRWERRVKGPTVSLAGQVAVYGDTAGHTLTGTPLWVDTDGQLTVSATNAETFIVNRRVSGPVRQLFQSEGNIRHVLNSASYGFIIEKWDGSAWEADPLFLSNTGQLVLNADTSTPLIINTTSETSRFEFQVNGVTSAVMGVVPGGFTIQRYDDTGAWLDNSLYLNSDNGQALFSSSINTPLVIRTVADVNRTLYQIAGVTRYTLSAEPGGLAFQAHDDTGAWTSTPLYINNGNGQVLVESSSDTPLVLKTTTLTNRILLQYSGVTRFSLVGNEWGWGVERRDATGAFQDSPVWFESGDGTVHLAEQVEVNTAGIVRGVADPVINSDATPKGYVDAAIMDVLADILPPQPAGISPGHDIIWLNQTDLDREMDMYQDMGMEWLRIDLDWPSIQPTSGGPYDWSAIDRVVTAAQSRNMSVMAILAYSPSWATSVPGNGHAPPSDPATFAAFATAAVTRYSTQGVKHWEVWNEPNLDNFWKNPDVGEYVTLLQAAYPAIKAADPTATVIAGALAPAVDGTNISPVTFTQQLYDLGAKPYFDAISVHPYCYPDMPSDETTALWNTFQRVPLMRNIMVANGDRRKKIWLTESGAPTGSDTGAVTEQQQADQIVDGIAMSRGWYWVGGWFLYGGRDRGTDPTDREQMFGVVKYDWTPKIALSAVTAALTG
jgi:hypothetical protein